MKIFKELGYIYVVGDKRFTSLKEAEEYIKQTRKRNKKKKI